MRLKRHEVLFRDHMPMDGLRTPGIRSFLWISMRETAWNKRSLVTGPPARSMAVATIVASCGFHEIGDEGVGSSTEIVATATPDTSSISS